MEGAGGGEVALGAGEDGEVVEHPRDLHSRPQLARDREGRQVKRYSREADIERSRSLPPLRLAAALGRMATAARDRAAATPRARRQEP